MFSPEDAISNEAPERHLPDSFGVLSGLVPSLFGKACEDTHSIVGICFHPRPRLTQL